MNYIQLSIIIPVFKVKDYVRKCLESVLAISNLNYEIIVVQDVHADNSLEDVPDLLNNPLIRICNQKNAGLSAARNAGLFLAKGEFVYFMDSDDYIDPIAFSNFFVRYTNILSQIQCTWSKLIILKINPCLKIKLII